MGKLKERSAAALEMAARVVMVVAWTPLPCAALPVVRSPLFSDPWRKVETKVLGQRESVGLIHVTEFRETILSVGYCLELKTTRS